jgi:hypothetical protein
MWAPMLASASAIRADTPPCSTLNGCTFSTYMVNSIQFNSHLYMQKKSSNKETRKAGEGRGPHLTAVLGYMKPTRNFLRGYLLNLESDRLKRRIKLPSPGRCCCCWPLLLHSLCFSLPRLSCLCLWIDNNSMIMKMQLTLKNGEKAASCRMVSWTNFFLR